MDSTWRCPFCGSDRLHSGEVWDDRESGPDYVLYCLCCDWWDYA